MQVSVSDAKAQLTDLARRAEAGEEVVLTRRGHPAVKLVPVGQERPDAAKRRALLEALYGSAKKDFGPTAEHCSDWLFDDNGLPA